MTTIERQREETRTTDTSGGGPRRGILVVLGLVLALVVGGLVGYLIRGDDTEEVGRLVPAGETELTTRHDEMLALQDAYEKAWQDGDGEGAQALFAPGGTLEVFGDVYSVDDGEVAQMVGNRAWTALEVHEPMLVYGDSILYFHTYDGVRSDVLTFTADGEVKILSHVIGDAIDR